jgi:hypothetical protein
VSGNRDADRGAAPPSGGEEATVGDSDADAIREQRMRARAEKQKAERLATRKRLIDRQRDVTAGLLDTVGASRLIVIDDDADAIDDYLTASARGEGDLPLIGAGELDPVDDRREWQDSANQRWNELSEQERVRILAEARGILGADPEWPLGPLHLLLEIFPPGRAMVVTPARWAVERAELIAGNAPLVLFDQDLGAFGLTGLDLLSEHLQDSGGNFLLRPAGILSASVTPEGELLKAGPAELAKVPTGSLMLIAKDDLSESRVQSAIQALRLTANLPHLLAARDHVVEGLRADMGVAADAVLELRPRVVEDVVYRSSSARGAWESETLARVARLYLVEATRERELADGMLPEIVSRARRLAGSAKDPDTASAEEAKRLHRIENYAPADWINRLGLPLANGDLFALTAKGESYLVLAAQPCDLVLRSDGERVAASGCLLPLREGRDDQTILEHSLPEVPPEPLPEKCVAQLKRGFHVDLRVLDLCWLDESGEAAVDSQHQIGESRLITEGVKKRATRLMEGARESVQHLEAAAGVGGEMLDFVKKQMSPPGVPLSFDPVVPTRISFPLRRIGRLSTHQAEALLVRYAAAQARAAFDHPLDSFEGG